MIFKPSNLFKAKEIYRHLTRQNDTTKQFLKLGTKDIPIPAKKQNVIDIEAVNRFNKANPRDDITNIQPVVKQSTIKQSNAGEVDEGVIQGAFDTATVQARDGGYPPPKYEAFKKRYLKKNMKADGGRIGYDEGSKLTDFVDVQASGSITGKNQVEGAPDGITANNQLINAIIRLDIPLSEKTNFLADYSYGKGRTKYEEGDKELFLDEGGYTDRNVGFGYNQDGEGFSGSVIRNLRTGDDDVQLRYKKSFADGGSIGGGRITGTPIGDRTGFANIFLEQGKKSRFGPGTDTIVIEGKEYRKISDKNNPNFGKYSFRESVSTGEKYPSGRIKSKEKQLIGGTEKQLRDRIKKGSFTGKALYKSYTPGYLAELKDIKKFVDNNGAKNIFYLIL